MIKSSISKKKKSKKDKAIRGPNATALAAGSIIEIACDRLLVYGEHGWHNSAVTIIVVPGCVLPGRGGGRRIGKPCLFRMQAAISHSSPSHPTDREFLSASALIQAAIRGFLSRRKNPELAEVRERRAARIEAAKRHEERTRAATTIQRQAPSHSARLVPRVRPSGATATRTLPKVLAGALCTSGVRPAGRPDGPDPGPRPGVPCPETCAAYPVCHDDPALLPGPPRPENRPRAPPRQVRPPHPAVLPGPPGQEGEARCPLHASGCHKPCLAARACRRQRVIQQPPPRQSHASCRRRHTGGGRGGGTELRPPSRPGPVGCLPGRSIGRWFT